MPHRTAHRLPHRWPQPPNRTQYFIRRASENPASALSRSCLTANVTETLIAQLVDKVVQERIAQIKAKVAAFKPAEENTDTPNTQSYRSVTGQRRH